MKEKGQTSKDSSALAARKGRAKARPELHLAG